MSHEMSSAQNNGHSQLAQSAHTKPGGGGESLHHRRYADSPAAYLPQVVAEQCAHQSSIIGDCTFSVQPSLVDTDAELASSSPNLMVYKDKYGNQLVINPAEISFSEYQDVWIQKHWLDIVARVMLVAPIVLLGIVGNLVIIYSMCKFKPFRSRPTNIFILNMAIADLLTTLVCPIEALFKDIYQFYVLGPFICRIEGFVNVTCLLVSSYSLIVLSSDWLLCVVKPFRTRITIRTSWLAVVLIWIVSILLSIPLIIWRQHRERQWKDLLEVWCCEMVEYTKHYWIAINFLLIYLPTIFMTIVLVIILAQMDKFEAKLRRSQVSLDKQVANGIGQTSAHLNNNNSLSINIKYRRRIVKILFTYLFTSVLCWTPLQFLIIYRHFRSKAIPAPWFFELAFWAQLSASLTAAMNPIIFGFLSQPFRRIVTRSLKLKFLDKMTDGTPGIGSKKQVTKSPQAQVTQHQKHAQQSPLPAAIYLRSHPNRPETSNRMPSSMAKSRSRRGSATDSKRVSFHASNVAFGRDNEVMERSPNLSSVHRDRPELATSQKLYNNTTSFIGANQRPLSLVSMDSINIEENLGSQGTRQQEGDNERQVPLKTASKGLNL